MEDTHDKGKLIAIEDKGIPALLVLVDGRSIKVRIKSGSELNNKILNCCDEQNKNLFFYTNNLIAIQLLDEVDETEKPSV